MGVCGTSDQFAQVRGFKVEITSPAGTEHDFLWDTFADGEVIGADADRFQTTSPGHKSVGEVTLRGAMTDKRAALCQWINETVNGKPWKRTVTITELVFGADGSVKDGKQYIYFDCFPTAYLFPRLNASSASERGPEPLMEEIRFAYRRCEAV
jgi:hypothetical protein